jgi:hypothetical protein
LKQKEKYKHERLRELKRKEKIVSMERELAEQRLDGSKVVYLNKSGEIRASTVRPPKKSSTPSARKQISWSSSSDSTEVTVSDITSSTITQSSFMSMMSDDLTLTEAKDTSPERSTRDQSTQQSMETSNICTCQSKEQRRHRVVQKPSRSSTSPSRRKAKESIQEVHHNQQQVNNSHGYATRSGRLRSGLYMEFDKPVSKSPARNRSPKRSRQDKENSHNLKEQKKQHKQHKDKHNEWKQMNRSKSLQNSIAVICTRDFGQTCPSPIIISQQHVDLEQHKNVVNMVTKAVQTHKMPDQMELSHSTKMFLPGERNLSLHTGQRVSFGRNGRLPNAMNKDGLDFSAGKCKCTCIILLLYCYCHQLMVQLVHVL